MEYRKIDEFSLCKVLFYVNGTRNVKASFNGVLKLPFKRIFQNFFSKDSFKCVKVIYLFNSWGYLVKRLLTRIIRELIAQLHVQ